MFFGGIPVSLRLMRFSTSLPLRRMFSGRRPVVTVNGLVLVSALFLLLFGNHRFFAKLLTAYPLSITTALPLFSVAAVFASLTVLLLAPLCWRHSTKPVLMTVLLLSSAVAYFGDTYGAVISDDMLRNLLHTNAAEAGDLLTGRLFVYVLLLGLLPSWLVWRTPLVWAGARRELWSRARLAGAALLAVIVMLFAFGSFYASFLRLHKDVRQYFNPGYYLYSAVRFAVQPLRSKHPAALTPVASDAAIPPTDVTRDLVILVVGETARADRFGINGYARDTTPALRRHGVYSFTDFRACGTSTAVSVPCMFLNAGEQKGASAIHVEENLLDVLSRAGVSVLWLDNNSDSKGVAERADFRDYRSPATNPVCDTECRDEGMLAHLQAYIDSKPKGDIFIVLHQMGNHGPAYYKRYPPAFERFTPVCRDADLSRCDRESIGNAYDNAILYTDHFLGKAIDLLKRNDHRFETALFYVSDHGESLGENGIYLHGMPKALAPAAQLHVPAVMWFGNSFHLVDRDKLRQQTGRPFNHEHVFHTVLSLFEVESATYDPGKDMLRDAKAHEQH